MQLFYTQYICIVNPISLIFHQILRLIFVMISNYVLINSPKTKLRKYTTRDIAHSSIVSSETIVFMIYYLNVYYQFMVLCFIISKTMLPYTCIIQL